MSVILAISGYLKANKLKNAETLLNRLGKALDLDLSGFQCERYRKDDSLYRFHGQVDLADVAFRDAYVDVPQRFSAVSGRWSMTVPRGYDAGVWDFEASSERTSIAGVEMVEFYVHRNK